MAEVTRAQTIQIFVLPDGRIGVKAGAGSLSVAEVLAGVEVYKFQLLQKITAGANRSGVPGLNIRNVP